MGNSRGGTVARLRRIEAGREILESAAVDVGLSILDICSGRRDSDLTDARMLVAQRCYEAGLSQKETGTILVLSQGAIHGLLHRDLFWSESSFDSERYRRPSPCSVEGCTARYASNGLCKAHNQRRRLGKPLDTPFRVVAPHGSGFNHQGYRRIGRNGKKVLAHRLVMEEILGRPLLANENVHHINGDRSDNRSENLELWTTSQPAGQRVADKIAWAVEFLTQYAPDVLTPIPVEVP